MSVSSSSAADDGMIFPSKRKREGRVATTTKNGSMHLISLRGGDSSPLRQRQRNVFSYSPAEMVCGFPRPAFFIFACKGEIPLPFFILI
jgi:hypothetical protein